MNLHTLDLPYYIYCEQVQNLPVEQPINVISNLIFFIIAFLAWRQRYGLPGHSAAIIAGLLVLAGITSIIWHAGEAQIGLLADISVVGILSLYLAWTIFRQIMGWPVWGALLAVVLLLGVGSIFRDFGYPFLTQDSGAFVPMAAMLFILGAWLTAARHSSAGLMLVIAGGWLACGILFRSLDLQLCDSIPFGTHFLWHIAAAAAAWAIVKALAVAQIEKISPEDELNGFLQSGANDLTQNTDEMDDPDTMR